jgi:hypothetical protein
MAGGQLPVPVSNALNRSATLGVRIGEDGRLWFTPPPPGPFSVDPITEWPALLDTVMLLLEVEQIKRQGGKP